MKPRCEDQWTQARNASACYNLIRCEAIAIGFWCVEQLVLTSVAQLEYASLPCAISIAIGAVVLVT